MAQRSGWMATWGTLRGVVWRWSRSNISPRSRVIDVLSDNVNFRFSGRHVRQRNFSNNFSKGSFRRWSRLCPRISDWRSRSADIAKLSIPRIDDFFQVEKTELEVEISKSMFLKNTFGAIPLYFPRVSLGLGYPTEMERTALSRDFKLFKVGVFPFFVEKHSNVGLTTVDILTMTYCPWDITT